MCGIAGIIFGQERSVDVDAALTALAHRGPDGQGQTVVPIGSTNVWLGHTRLAIQDLTEAGAQPMASADGRWLITFNGEIYNHQDLRRDLTRTWRGHSDTETLVEAISQWGVEPTVRRLNGIFAFGVLDRVHNALYLVRDPFGVKPLYYAQTENGFGFASEIRSLSAMTKRRFGIDRESLSTFLSLRFVPSPNTLLEGLMRLPPGHILRRPVLENRPETMCYVEPSRKVFTGSLEDAIDGYQERVGTAVRRQLLSDVPVGVLLSGGIDSAVVAALAADAIGGANVHGVSLPSDYSTEHSKSDAADLARRIGARYRVVPVAGMVEAFVGPLGLTGLSNYLGPNAGDVSPQWLAPMQDQFDAVLYLGPMAAIHFERPKPWHCDEPALAERVRRANLQRPGLGDRVKSQCVQ